MKKDKSYTGWEIKSFYDVLQVAAMGNVSKIEAFKSSYPLCATSKDYSLLVIIRPFQVQRWEDERRILNAPAKPKEEFQMGITVSGFNIEQGSGTEGSMAIPNYNYRIVSIQEDGSIVFGWDNGSIVTNQNEMYRKLQGIYCRKSSEKEIAEKFNSLCNEIITGPPPPELVYETLESKVMGTMTFNSKYDWYEGNINIDGQKVDVTLSLTYPNELTQNLKKMDKLLEKKFWEKVFQKMLKPMVSLKNECWLDEDENGKEEPPITAEELQKQVTIKSIGFDDECWAEIYCDDDDIFWGHDIVISTNERGTFQDANLAG